jgi:hypothetical protein
MTSTYEWTRSEALPLAMQGCTHCFGLGLRDGSRATVNPCGCVLRKIFKSCHDRFRQCVELQRTQMPVLGIAAEEGSGPQNKRQYSRRNEEYIADFVNVARRVLAGNVRQLRVFQLHFLYGAEWKACASKLGLDKGEFFHEVYRVQEKLGLHYRELQPYALFPLDEYFSAGCPNRLREKETK